MVKGGIVEAHNHYYRIFACDRQLWEQQGYDIREPIIIHDRLSRRIRTIQMKSLQT